MTLRHLSTVDGLLSNPRVPSEKLFLISTAQVRFLNKVPHMGILDQVFKQCALKENGSEMKEAKQSRDKKPSRMYPQLNTSFSLILWKRFTSSPYLNQGLGEPMALLYSTRTQVKQTSRQAKTLPGLGRGKREMEESLRYILKLLLKKKILHHLHVHSIS